MSKVELNPCLCCSGIAIDIRDIDIYRAVYPKADLNKVICNVCRAVGGACFTQQEAIAAWNKITQHKQD